MRITHSFAAALTLAFTFLPGAAGVHAADSASIPAEGGTITFHPVEHASFAITQGDLTLYVDPVGDAARYANLPRPKLILITDIHEDHFSVAVLQALAGEGVTLVAPAAVAEKLPEALRAKTTPVANGQTLLTQGLEIHAVPMYNLTAERLKFHDKGRGNGYVVALGGKRIYISGDTEDIPEMRALENIDVAFVCMNLPYTMTEEQAASAVREFKPRIVYPYHYRGAQMSDVQKFKQAVGASAEVRLLEWYPQK